jgi:hypothetical protein
MQKSPPPLRRLLTLVLLLLSIQQLTAQTQKFTISGFVSDTASGEMLIGASIYVKGTTTGAAANVYGFY